MFTTRRIVIGGAILGACIVIILAWRLFFSGPAEPDVATAKVARGAIEHTVEATGTLEPKELVSVGAQVSGRLDKLNVAIGDVVRQGDLIGLIDPRTQTNALETARADLANMKAQLAGAKATLARTQLAYRRQQALGAGEATSQQNFETARAELQSAQASYDALLAQIRSATVSVDTAQVQLGFTKITAPMDGVVVAVVTKQGQTVNSMQSAPTIVILAKLDVMTIKAEISEADVIDVKPGLPVYFTILGDPDKRYEAKLRLIEPAPESIVTKVDSSTSAATSTTNTAIYYNAQFEVPNADGRLRALMTAKVSIVLDRRANALSIPSTALGTKAKDGSYTVRVKTTEGTIENRRIRIGLDNKVNVEVVSGLREGEAVVIGEASANKDTGRRGPPGF